jgi:L-lactate dehydrogenase complex protein LldG
VSAREEVLERVRAALAVVSPMPAASVARDYRTHSDAGIDEFIRRVQHYDAGIERVAADDLDEAVRDHLRASGVNRLVAPDGLPDPWLTGVELLSDQPPLDAAALDGADGVLTTCAIAIAETGTVVLDGTAGMGRRALTLVPDYHLIVVRAEQIVGSLPEALAQLEPTRPLTFISGPSATVDIEMVRVKGVHGPRRLDVIIAG